MKKIAFFDAKTYDIMTFNSVNKDYEIHYFEDKLNINTVILAKGMDAACAFVNDDISKEVIDKLDEYGIHLVALRCAGFNNVDIEYAYKKVHIVRVPAYSPYAVAEHAMALLLSLNRKIHKAYLRTREFNFNIQDLTGFDLFGKTVGVIGTGKIGVAFINICKGFGMNVLAYDPFPRNDLDVSYVSVDELVKESDIISLHCPLTNETKHIINKDTISKMKQGAIIVNTSRGALVDSQALLQGLKDKKLFGACLDVYEEEANLFFEDNSSKIIQDDILSLLICLPNVIMTSHQGYLTKEALENIAETTLNNITLYFKDEYLENEICYRCKKNPSGCMTKRNKNCW
ncbi:MAG: 2-hydroxyacid dehydrogenase [Erysipelotrichaceae bacterium]|nr:2-hydroxyacid dehydrogenase [Erysipelotrichaceae bacterium]